MGYGASAPTDNRDCPVCGHEDIKHDEASDVPRYGCRFKIIYKPWWSKWKHEKRCGCNFTRNLIRLNATPKNQEED